jgi:undecaprenyl-diphosphatase
MPPGSASASSRLATSIERQAAQAGATSELGPIQRRLSHAENRRHAKSEAGKLFEIVIQLGAILAVVVFSIRRLWDVVVSVPNDPGSRRFAWAIIVAFLPAAALGALLHDFIKTVLFSPWVVVTTLILGGVAILVFEWLAPKPRYCKIEAMPISTAFSIGLCQSIALIPGVSRAGATILGAEMLGVDRQVATEFSFYLAIPTMLGAAVFDLWNSS